MLGCAELQTPVHIGAAKGPAYAVIQISTARARDARHDRPLHEMEVQQISTVAAMGACRFLGIMFGLRLSSGPAVCISSMLLSTAVSNS
jgi:hypothetical protein